MAQQPQQVQTQPPSVRDPDNVQETFCDGQFCISLTGPFATLVFTHNRPEPDPLFKTGTFKPSAIVRARVVLTLPNLTALRDYIGNFIQAVEAAGSAAPAAGGTTTKH
jgi:hypothetical protein